MEWNCAPTCIGSLPHLDERRAVDAVLTRLREVPYWPQLPAKGFAENMYAQFARRLPGVDIDEEGKRVTVDTADYDPMEFYEDVLEERVDRFACQSEGFSGLHEFLGRYAGKARAVKGQVTGPVSMGLQVIGRDGKPAVYDEAYGEIIRKNINMCARYQISRLKEKSANVVMFLDEPSISLVGTPFAPIDKDKVTAWIDESFEKWGCVKGLHCCGNTDWPMVLSSSLDILSFDAYGYAFTVSLFPAEFKRFLERGGSLAWGLVPNMEHRLENETASSLADRLDDSLRTLAKKGFDPEAVLRSSLITPQCGLGGLCEADAEKVLDLLVDTSAEVRRRHRLEG
jgi:methionine synthase II (cobalamin-independent)